ncbi:uncharacterized protein BDR25DRAFT_291660 [Lindgomyces ingoldianus]|uniref:Uncharacterized protein n=1 Tax=Lindgomyces ingoldianus TaxID=673940 RepID=A0ACB6QL05_9PLEO|nr:uncharacterized protein BDR25DRAFT_291660 [Lindgomyces ingoldianus]KAF2467683.1 hypothetical protein BDR25DRAFT_291660 [Lindgomyces ingoldianus]
MAQPMLTPFWPLHVGRSDGKGQVTVKGIKVNNGPDPKQLDRTPNQAGQCDYFREIDRDEPKHMDWRRKLGGMLLREIGGADYADRVNNTILWNLPEGYRLYEHIKSKADGQVKAVKNHSGGGHDRQDAYLYGYPRGPKKRFRSPADFFPHLLWLSTDESGDYDNCTCKLCSPYQPEDDKPAKQDVKAITSTPGVKKEVGSPAATPPRPVNRNPIVQVPIRAPAIPATGSAPVPISSKPAMQNAPRIKPPSPLNSSPLPQPRSMDQQVDSQYGKFLSRTGEVVWFFRNKTRAWGLGLIIQRWISEGGSSKCTYSIQPLSYPHSSLEPEIVTTHNDIRPWLAWSAPGYTYPYLQNSLLTYEQVDWDGLRAGNYGATPDSVCEVDASILAAKGIDSTYVLFERLKTIANKMGQEERHWNGIFFGAEKIWNGEPVRLRIAGGSDIMVVTAIIERTVPNPAQSGTTRTIIEAIGDIYAYATLPAPDLSSPPEPPPNNNLPLRMREDMRWRNNSLLPNTRTLAYWKLISTQSRLDFSDIKGRWYETSIVFAAPFHEAVKKGEGGNGIWMNSRGDATAMGSNLGTRKQDRIEAFGNAIPQGTQFVEGFEAPKEELQQQQPQASVNVQGQGQVPQVQHPHPHPHSNPHPHPHPHPHQHQQVHGLETIGMDASVQDGFAIDDFMNLDGMEEAAMPFGGEFVGHEDGFHFG